MITTQDNMRTFLADDDLPEQAADLLGNEVADAFRLAREETGAARREPVVIAATGDGDWRAGLYLIVEPVGEGPGAERVASIRQLVVRPSFRGRGLGGWLLRRVHTVATELGCRRIRSTAGWGCPDHLAMYDRMGYSRIAGDQRPYLVEKVL